MNEFEKFESLKATNNNHVILGGTKNILISAPHAVEQIRNGKIKYAEPETALIALYLNNFGYPCIIKTHNDNDDANFDDKSDYRDNLIDFCKNNDIRFILDLHQLSDKREMDFCIATGGLKHKNLLGKFNILNIFKQELQDNDFIVTVNDPFDAFAPNVVSRICANNHLPSILLEINCKIVSAYCGGKKLNIVKSIIKDILLKIEKEII